MFYVQIAQLYVYKRRASSRYVLAVLGFGEQHLFDPGYVMVPPAGRPTALPLWVPALKAGCLRGGGMVSGRCVAEE